MTAEKKAKAATKPRTKRAATPNKKPAKKVAIAEPVQIYPIAEPVPAMSQTQILMDQVAGLYGAVARIEESLAAGIRADQGIEESLSLLSKRVDALAEKVNKLDRTWRLGLDEIAAKILRQIDPETIKAGYDKLTERHADLTSRFGMLITKTTVLTEVAYWVRQAGADDSVIGRVCHNMIRAIDLSDVWWRKMENTIALSAIVDLFKDPDFDLEMAKEAKLKVAAPDYAPGRTVERVDDEDVGEEEAA